MGDVYITAMGVASPIGNSVEEFKRNFLAGASGIQEIRGKQVPEEFPIPYAGIVNRDSLIKFKNQGGKNELDYAKFTTHSTLEALQNITVEDKIDAIVYGTAEGVNFDHIKTVLESKNLDSIDWESARSEGAINVIKNILASLGHSVPSDMNCISVNSACASGNQAIGLAMQRIRSGMWKRAIVGGVDARCNKANLMNFHLLGALTTDDVPPHKASRPFSGDRSGFVRGEGAITLIIESEQAMLARKATGLAKVLGYGLTSDAFRLTDGRDDASCVIKAMQLAIGDAGLKEDQIDAISAHGTSTKLNDRLETFACKKVFGERAKKVPVSSLKSQTGHSTVAAGAMEALASVIMLQEQVLGPTLNLNIPDPECDLDYVPNEKRKAKINYILSNNFGFGGQNACLVFGRA